MWGTVVASGVEHHIVVIAALVCALAVAYYVGTRR